MIIMWRFSKNLFEIFANIFDKILIAVFFIRLSESFPTTRETFLVADQHHTDQLNVNPNLHDFKVHSFPIKIWNIFRSSVATYPPHVSVMK